MEDCQEISLKTLIELFGIAIFCIGMLTVFSFIFFLFWRRRGKDDPPVRTFGHSDTDYEHWLTVAGVPAEEIDKCMAWAFGENWGSVALYTLDELWNERHSDIFVMRGSDLIYESTIRIGRAYMEHGRQKEILKP